MNQVEVKRRQIESLANLLGAAALLLLGNYMGENGLAYFAAAYEVFSFMWIVVGQNVSDALGRMLRAKNARNQYKNVYRIRRYALVSQGILGLVMSVLMAALGGIVVTNVFHMPNGAFLPVILAVALLFRTVESILLGYFQGTGSELPTAVSAMLRQVLFIGFGFLFGNLFVRYGEMVSALLGQSKFVGMYGAIGVVVSAALTELLLLLFLAIIYKGGSKKNMADPAEGLKSIDSFGSTLRVLYGNMTGEILTGLLQRLPIWIGLFLLGMAASELVNIEITYGIYYGKYLVLTGGTACLIDALVLPAAAKVQAYVRRDEPKYAKSIFQIGLHVTVVYGLFFSVFLTAMGNYVAPIFCKSGVTDAGAMLSYGAFIILFAAISGYFYRFLWIVGKRHLLLLGLGAMNLIFLVSASLFVNVGKLGVNSYIYAGMIANVTLCALLGIWAWRELRPGIDWVQMIGLPAGCACVVGLISMFVSKAISPHLGVTVTVIVCLAISWIVYWIALVLLRNFREQELKHVPAGGLVKALGQLLRVYS